MRDDDISKSSVGRREVLPNNVEIVGIMNLGADVLNIMRLVP